MTKNRLEGDLQLSVCRVGNRQRASLGQSKPTERFLWAENVLARRSPTSLLLKETERLSERVLSLPTGTGVSRQDIADVCAIIRLVLLHGKRAQGRLERCTHERCLNSG